MGNISIKLIVGGENTHIMLFEHIPDFKFGNSHLQTKGFGLVGSRDNTTVIVGKDDNRPPFQIRTEKALA